MWFFLCLEERLLLVARIKVRAMFKLSMVYGDALLRVYKAYHTRNKPINSHF